MTSKPARKPKYRASQATMAYTDMKNSIHYFGCYSLLVDAIKAHECEKFVVIPKLYYHFLFHAKRNKLHGDRPFNERTVLQRSFALRSVLRVLDGMLETSVAIENPGPTLTNRPDRAN